VVGKAKTSNESEMALFYECTPQCAQKELDTADIVRDAIFQQLRRFRILIAHPHSSNDTTSQAQPKIGITLYWPT
jgi:hypothetical protein